MLERYDCYDSNFHLLALCLKNLLSVIVPAYNEADQIRSGKLDRLVISLQKLACRWELVVVDDGSSDCTAALVEQLVSRNPHVSLLKEPHCGKGFALLVGMRTAHGDYILFTDLDQATPIKEIKRLLPWLDRGYDLVYGTRGLQRQRAPLSRKCVSWGFVILRRMLIGSFPSLDTQCGFKLFANKPLQDIVDHLHFYTFDNRHPINGHKVTPGFDVELLLVAQQRGYLVKPVSVDWSSDQCRGMNISTGAWQGLVDILHIRRALRQGIYTFSH